MYVQIDVILSFCKFFSFDAWAIVKLSTLSYLLSSVPTQTMSCASGWIWPPDDNPATLAWPPIESLATLFCWPPGTKCMTRTLQELRRWHPISFREIFWFNWNSIIDLGLAYNAQDKVASVSLLVKKNWKVTLPLQFCIEFSCTSYPTPFPFSL